MVRLRSKSVKALSEAEVRDEDVDALFMVWLVSRSTEDLLDSVLAPAGLNGDEFAIYSMLTAAPTMTPTELARWMAAPATTVSSYVKRFEARGHVSREPNPDDRRSYRIRITPAGRRAHRAAAKLFLPIRTQVTDALAEQDGDVRESLLRLRTVVDDLRNPTRDADPHAGWTMTSPRDARGRWLGHVGEIVDPAGR
jgi:DNA-binding MarR family transcriptional regulator